MVVVPIPFRSEGACGDAPGVRICLSLSAFNVGKFGQTFLHVIRHNYQNYRSLLTCRVPIGLRRQVQWQGRIMSFKLHHIPAERLRQFVIEQEELTYCERVHLSECPNCDATMADVTLKTIESIWERVFAEEAA